MAELSSKDLVNSLFRLEDLPRIPFIPWVCSFAAQLEQVQVEDMLSDAGLLATSLSNAQKLFGYDAICNVFDSSLEAEALGCEVEWGGEGDLPTVATHPLAEGARLEDISVLGLDARGRIPVVIEATRRLNIVMGKQVAVIGVVTGPVTLAGHLSGKSFLNDLTERPENAGRTIALAGVACLNLARKYCELGVDAVAVADEMLGQIGPEEYRLAAGPLKSIWNVAKFYNVRTLLLGRGCSERQAVSSLGLGADGVAVSGDFDAGHLRLAASEGKRCYAGSIPASSLLEVNSPAVARVKEYMAGQGRGFFVSTEWEVPFSASVEIMHGLVEAIREGQL